MDSATTILLVEDSLSLLRLYSHVLARAGYTVLQAATGSVAIQVLAEHRPDIVLLDRVLPDMDGAEICQRIKSQPDLASIYVVMLSALKTTEDDRVSGLEAGADDYIVKPIGKRELLARIQVAVRLQQTQAALRISEAMFRTLAENSPDIISRFDQKFRYLYVTPAIEKMTHKERDTYIGKSIWELDRPPEIIELWRQAFQEVFDQGKARQLEFSLEIDGEPRTLDTRLVPEFDANGSVASILAVTRDFTDRVQAEQEIARLAAVVEQAVEAVIITEPDGVIVYANGAYEKMTGHDPVEIMGRQVQSLDAIYPDPAFREQFDSALRHGHKWEGTAACMRKNAGPCDIEIVTFPITDRTGKTINFAIIQRDITQRRRAEREREVLLSVASALRIASTRDEMVPIILEQMMVLLDVVGATITKLDPEGGEPIIEMSRGEHAFMTGRRMGPGRNITAEVIASGKPFQANDVKTVFPKAMSERMENVRSIAAVPLTAQHHNAGVLWIGSHAPVSEYTMDLLLAIGDMAANALHRAALYEEIQDYAAELEVRVVNRTAELADANERLRELDKLKSKFVSNVSHELRTPISNLKLYMSLLQRGKEEKRGQYEAMLNMSIERLGQLVEDILNLSRLEIAQEQAKEMEPTDLNAVARQIVTLHQPQAEASGISLSFEPDGNLPLVRGDFNQLSQLITNLVANALSYTHKGYVRVMTLKREDSNTATLLIKDSGVGILSEDIPHLFERFYRGGHTQLADIPGTGLGLAIVKEIVEIHRGTIFLTSEVDTGTQFEIDLPAISSAPDDPIKLTRPDEQHHSLSL